MFTIKYRYWMSAPVENGAGTQWVSHEQIWGPFEFVTKEPEYDAPNHTKVYGHYQNKIDAEHGALPMTFGPISDDIPEGQPRPTLWVMNDQGATVAKYDL